MLSSTRSTGIFGWRSTDGLFAIAQRAIALVVVVLLGAVPAAVAQSVDYQRDIKPLLQARCFACHGALKQESGLRLDTVGLMLQGGDSGPAVEPTHPSDSPLLERVAAADPDERMPPEGEPLTAEQIAALRQWIESGAPAPKDEQPEADPRAHWAFQPIRRPSPPIPPGWTTAAATPNELPALPNDSFFEDLVATLARAWSMSPPDDPVATLARAWNMRLSDEAVATLARAWNMRLSDEAVATLARAWNISPTLHPIDSFIDAALAHHGLTPRPPTSKAVQLRRVYLDLIGLPPTRQQLNDFLDDTAEDAYERVVERLLQDQRHGERWARHWMDVWRYSDWYGRRDQKDVRNSAGQMFRWRDWIVRSLNEGKGYDRMIQEMLAADEICPEDYEAGVATGYLIRNYYSLNPNDWMRSVVEHTGKAFLGLTINCAHCHDHKYDPIAQDEYFNLRAFFEPIYIRQDRVAGEPDPGMFENYSYAGSRKVQRLGGLRTYDHEPEAVTWFYHGGDERNRATERGSMPPAVPGFLDFAQLDIQPLELPPRAWYPGLRTEIQQSLRDDVLRAIAAAQQAWDAVPKEVTVDPAARQRLDEAQAAYDAAIELARQSDQPRALSGEQSLLLDSTAGRAALENRLEGRLHSLVDGLTVAFECRLLHDGHFNLQLLKDSQRGLTAAYVGWQAGQIKAYVPDQPGEVVIGGYDPATGQDHFAVVLVLQPTLDQALLTIQALPSQQRLVDRVAVKLGGWNPILHEQQTLFLDAQSGSIVAIDDLVISRPGAAGGDDAEPPLWVVSFESPQYADQSSPIGTDGWRDSPFASAAGVVQVSAALNNAQLQQAAAELKLARQQLELPELKSRAAQTVLEAAQAAAVSLEARIASENAKYGLNAGDQEPTDAESPLHRLLPDGVELTETQPTADSYEYPLPRLGGEGRVRGLETPRGQETLSQPSNPIDLARAASTAERDAAVLTARGWLLSGEVALIEARLKPADEAARGKAIEAAGAELMAARTALAEALAAQSDEARAESYAPLSPQFPRHSTGRRRALAEWITHRDHPLTARVAVNHIWLRHFHQPLVDSMVDFGRNGAPPTHPELLDWLASELIDSGWDMKHLHRLIVTSQAYRRVSSVGEDQASVERDPENRYLWRMNVGRMEAEVVRDSLLYVAGRLDLTQGGVELENQQALTTHRRSLYYSCYPEAGGKSALGELFDAPDPLDCYRRVSSIVPQQALALTNSQLVQESAELLVQRWSEVAGEPLIDGLFETILSRTPAEQERQLCQRILDQQRQLAELSDAALAEQRARESLARILMNHNDFVTVR